MSGDHLGYARVSTQKESLELKLDALRAAGCARVWSDVGTGQHARSILTEVLDYLRPGDTLIVWRLDRIGRRTGELIQLVTDLASSAGHRRPLADRAHRHHHPRRADDPRCSRCLRPDGSQPR